MSKALYCLCRRYVFIDVSNLNATTNQIYTVLNTSTGACAILYVMPKSGFLLSFAFILLLVELFLRICVCKGFFFLIFVICPFAAWYIFPLPFPFYHVNVYCLKCVLRRLNHLYSFCFLYALSM
jgi:hypothetical protein